MSIKVNEYISTRIGKLRLMKDMKYGRVNLRQSLIELSEFSDVDKIYVNRKQFYDIEDQQVILKDVVCQENQEQIQMLISPIDKLQRIRKQKINKKIKEKIGQIIQGKNTGSTKARVPKTWKMFERFTSKYKNQMHISYKQQLRESEMNLSKIKKNEKLKYELNNNENDKLLYKSKIKRYDTKESQKGNVCQGWECSRKTFMSLKTSLPERDKFCYPSIRVMMDRKLKQKIKGPQINIKNIEISLQNYLNHSLKKVKGKIEKECCDVSLVNSHMKSKSPQLYAQTDQMRKKTRSNVEKSFNRSQETTKSMIDTMSVFYETKHLKSQNFDLMFKNLKYDRPLTSSIRRRNYTILGKDTLNPIREYREISQQQRMRIREKNHSFYMRILDRLQGYYEQNIPTTVHIIEQLKKIFESEYIFSQKIFDQLLKGIEDMEKDSETEYVLNQIQNFVSFDKGVNLKINDGLKVSNKN